MRLLRKKITAPFSLKQADALNQFQLGVSWRVPGHPVTSPHRAGSENNQAWMLTLSNCAATAVHSNWSTPATHRGKDDVTSLKSACAWTTRQRSNA